MVYKRHTPKVISNREVCDLLEQNGHSPIEDADAFMEELSQQCEQHADHFCTVIAPQLYEHDAALRAKNVSLRVRRIAIGRLAKKLGHYSINTVEETVLDQRQKDMNLAALYLRYRKPRRFKHIIAFLHWACTLQLTLGDCLDIAQRHGISNDEFADAVNYFASRVPLPPPS